MKQKRATIYIGVDDRYEMASVNTRLGTVPDGYSKYDFGMVGNFWDFHPGCHGIYCFGDFKGYTGFANAIELHLRRLGYEVSRKVNTNWKFR